MHDGGKATGGAGEEKIHRTTVRMRVRMRVDTTDGPSYRFIRDEPQPKLTCLPAGAHGGTKFPAQAGIGRTGPGNRSQVHFQRQARQRTPSVIGMTTL